MKRTSPTGLVLCLFLIACSSKRDPNGGIDAPGGADGGSDTDGTPCVTQITGTVFAPNGTLPLFGVTVYIPTVDPGPIGDGLLCGKCVDMLPGQPIIQTLSVESGQFTLSPVTPGTNVPVVITTGKWRRQIVVPSVGKCQNVQLTADDTRLPRAADDLTTNTTSVDLPKIALSTGGADQLECLIRKLGIEDKEITTNAETGHVHMYSDLQASGVGVSSFDSGFDGGKSFPDSQTLWGNATDPGKLGDYDLVLLSCEGEQDPETKPQEAMDHMKAYADAGGRVFMEHYHNIWIEGSDDPNAGTQKPAVWPQIGTFKDLGAPESDPTIDTIDELHNPKGASFATWMLDPQVMGSPTRDSVSVSNARTTASAVDNTKAERWVNLVSSTSISPQMYQFTTPNEVDADQRCGKVVFSDMHVSQSDAFADTYPANCGSDLTMTAQEKALAFMFFDISSCVGIIQ